MQSEYFIIAEMENKKLNFIPLPVEDLLMAIGVVEMAKEELRDQNSSTKILCIYDKSQRREVVVYKTCE